MNLAEIYEASRTRSAKQHLIEDAIGKFSPSYMEASELLAAVVGSMRHKYDNLLSVDLEHCLKELFDQLEEEDRCEDDRSIVKEDMDYDRQQEQQAYMDAMRTYDEQ